MDSTHLLHQLGPATFELADRQPFLSAHRLVDHPALSLENLAEVIPQLPPNHVFHSNGRLSLADNFDNAHREHRPEQELRDALERLRTVDAYIMVREPETHPSFQPLFRELKKEVAQWTRSRDPVADFSGAKLYLFIASPNSVTPFHIDRYSTLLMQIRGSKEVVVYPAWDQRVVADRDVEDYFAGTGRPPWRPEAEPLGQRFEFSPGQTLHIPFAAGHHVRNGSDDVSISLSIIFKTSRSRQLTQALHFNRHLRRAYSRFGAMPGRVAIGAPGVAVKSGAWAAGHRAAGWLRSLVPARRSPAT